MRIAGFRKGETYPETGGRAGAAGALLNRNVAALPFALNSPFTPDSGGFGSLVAAIVFTPKVSGVIQVATSLDLVNGSDAEIYSLAVGLSTGTGLTVSGGENTSNGWVMGSTTPPVVGGTSALAQLLGVDIAAIGSGAPGALSTFGISQPTTVGTPVLITVTIAQTATHALAGIAAFGLSVVELP